MITVAALSPSLDITFVVPRLRLGEIHRPDAVHRVAGGKPLNLARAAVTVGASVSTVAILGGSNGRFIEAALVEAGIGVRAVQIPEETRTCVSIAAGDRDDLTEIYPYAPPVPEQAWQAFRTELDAELGDRSGWLAINGSTPQGLAPDDFAALVRIGRSAGLRVAVDTHGEALAAALPAGPDLVKINRQEAAALLNQDAAGADLADLTTIIGDRSGGEVIITDGADGAIGRDRQGRSHRVTPPPGVVGRFPVGSGDAFLGGYLAAIESGAALPEALRLATGSAAANALLPGPGNLDSGTADDLAARAVLTELQ